MVLGFQIHHHMETLKHQIIIIGGGLAGLSCALLLKQQGKDVAVFEKGTYPEHKVCGEYISYEAWPFLKRLGIDPEILQFPRLRYLQISAPNGYSINSKLTVGAYGISRFYLDNLLYQKCLEQKIKVYTNTKVNQFSYLDEKHLVVADNGTFECQYLVSAHGKRSNIDLFMKRPFIAKVKRKNYVGIKYHIKTNIANDRIELHNFENGYCGISKVEDDIVCLCYLTEADNLKKYKGDIKAMEAGILHQNPYLKKYFSESEFLYKEPLVISNVSFWPKKNIEDHVFMIGDSAGLIAPLCGNGMSIAFQSAAILNDAFALNTNRQTIEAYYHKKWNQTFKNRLKIGRSIQHLFGSKWTTTLIIMLLKPFPFLVRWIESKTHGKVF
jgi:menaquinone-9 beta-reductase